jgi:hypothetical protein
MNITLDDQEAEVLREVLSNAVGDLRYETASADNPGFKRGLEDRQATLKGILDQLDPSRTTS